MQVVSDDLMGLLVGIGEMADRSVRRRLLALKGEGNTGILALLHLQLGKVNASAVDARRCAGLKAHQIESHFAQTVGQSDGRKHAVRTAVVKGITDDNPSLKIGSGRNNHRFHRIMCTNPRSNTGHSIVFGCDFNNFALF